MMNIMNVRKSDRKTLDLMSAESTRQKETITLIPSENYASAAVRAALGSVLTNKYSEGYPGRRYYNGNEYIDAVESLACDRAKKLFNVPYANVQPYSGSPANTAVYFALLTPGDTIMGLKLSSGGHLTHGHPNVTFSGKYFHSVQYEVGTDGVIDMKAAGMLAKKEKPKLIIIGTTAYSQILDWAGWRRIADSVGAWLMADISHIAGLVAGGAHSSPVPYVDIVMTTTHKTLRGPRGAMILVTDRGLKRDPALGEKIDKAIIPGLQGGPHDNTTAAIAIALFEASQPSFKTYAKQIVKNADALARTLAKNGLTIVSGGTKTHLMLVDLRPQGKTGKEIADALEEVGIVVNRNTIPHDPASPFAPNGIRIGTPAATTRGMKEREMKKIGEWITAIVKDPDNAKLKAGIQKEVKQLTKKFPTS